MQGRVSGEVSGGRVSISILFDGERGQLFLGHMVYISAGSLQFESKFLSHLKCFLFLCFFGDEVESS